MTLVRKELIRPDRAEFPGDDGFRFGHILIRDAAYEAMPKLLRAELHERYAAWLERTAGTRLLEYEEILGYHLEHAYRLRCEIGPLDGRTRTLGIHAGDRLGAAGRRPFERLDTPAAANLLGRAWELLPPDELRRLEFGLTLGTTLWLRGVFAKADEVTSEVYERAARLGYEGLRMRTRIERFDAHFHPELSTADMRTELEHAIEVFETAGDDVGLADAWRVVGMTHWMENHAAEQASALTRALVYARRLGANPPVLTPIVSQLATGLSHGPTPVDEAVVKCEELLALAPANLAVEGSVKRTLGRLRAMQGRFDEARTSMARGISILEELGMTVQAAASRGQGSVFVELLAGDLVAAERLARESVETLRAAGERSYLSTNAAVLGDLAFRLGNDEEAERMARLAQELSTDDDVSSQCQWRLVHAEVLARRGLQDEAEALAGEAVAITESTDFPHLRGLSWRTLAVVLLAGGKRPEAVEAAETALGLFEQKGITVEADNVRRLLLEARGPG